MPYVTVDGTRLYYETHGDGEPLLLIHGLGSSTRDWEYQIPVFAKSYQVVVYDVRGHGRSDKPPGPYHLPLFARDAAQLMESLGLPPAHIVGISMGGMIAYQLAVSFPGKARCLIVVNANPELPLTTWRDRVLFWQRLLIVRLLGMRKMGEVLSNRLFVKPEQETLRKIFVERWAENDPRAYLTAMRAIFGWSVVDQLDAIQIPVLIIAADQDYTPVEEKERYAAMMPRAQVVRVDDSRHATPVEKPDVFNQIVLSYLPRI